MEDWTPFRHLEKTENIKFIDKITCPKNYACMELVLDTVSIDNAPNIADFVSVLIKTYESDYVAIELTGIGAN